MFSNRRRLRELLTRDDQEVPWFPGTFFGSFAFKNGTEDERLGLLRLLVLDISPPGPQLA